MAELLRIYIHYRFPTLISLWLYMYNVSQNKTCHFYLHHKFLNYLVIIKPCKYSSICGAPGASFSLLSNYDELSTVIVKF